jgi:hypothetical protein
MSTMYTTGEWFAKEGHEAAFVEAWGAFATWAHSKSGAGTLRLAQDLDIPNRFVSLDRGKTQSLPTSGKPTLSSQLGWPRFRSMWPSSSPRNSRWCGQQVSPRM